MNAARLLALYERIAEAPDAVARLRRFVLDLAVRGKLAPQDAGDEPAAELLKRIAREKARLAKAGEINPPSDPSGGEAKHSSLDTPAHWCAVTVRDVLHELQTGPFGSSLHQNDYRERGTPVINPASIQDGAIVPISKMAVGPDTLERLSSFCLRAGDIVMARRGEMGRCALVTEREAGWLCGTGSLILRPSPLIFGQFLVLLIGSPFGRDYLGGSAVGTTMQNLNQAILLRMRFGLPPLAEQHRIVAKVDELMALCDRLEAARTAREATRDRLTAASLARLNTPDPETFPADTRFALDALPALTTRPDQIKHLRQTILNLAVRGGLSREAAWTATPKRLGDFASLQNGYAFKSEWFARTGIRLLRNANVAHGMLDWTDEVRLPAERAAEFERFRLGEGDVVVSLDRPFIVTGTKVARVRDTDLPALLLQRVGRFVLSPSLDATYLFLWVTSPHFAIQIDPGRSNGVPHISSKQVEAASIFVPPLAEQHRIVTKVSELMSLCVALEAGLTAANTARTRLLEATLAEALTPGDATALEAAE